jgi:hypothetical protein
MEYAIDINSQKGCSAPHDRQSNYAVNLSGSAKPRCGDAFSSCNSACTQYVLYDGLPDAVQEELFTTDTIKNISQTITKVLRGTLPTRDIIVADHVICDVLSNIYQNYIPQTGDIYSRYIIPLDNQSSCSWMGNIIQQAIQVIVSNVKNTYDMEKQNKDLTIWTTILGESNKHGLRSHPPIKIRKRNTNNRGMVSFMNY